MKHLFITLFLFGGVVGCADHLSRLEQARFEKENSYLLGLMHAVIDANPKTFQGEFSKDKFSIRTYIGQRAIASAEPSKGEIFVATALLRKVPNDDALAAIIAHELAHIIKGHSLGIHPALTASQQWQAADAEAEVWRQQVDFSSPRLQEAMRKLNEIELVKTEIRKAIIPDDVFANWTESEADEVGLEFYLRTSFDPKSFTWYFWGLLSESDKIECKAAVDARDLTSPLLVRGTGTHPSACWRIYNIEITEMGKPVH